MNYLTLKSKEFEIHTITTSFKNSSKFFEVIHIDLKNKVVNLTKEKFKGAAPLVSYLGSPLGGKIFSGSLFILRKKLQREEKL